MEKEKALAKLKELGIETQNYYNKKTYVWNGKVCIGIFPIEAAREPYFYFSTNGDEKLYSISGAAVQACVTEQHFGKDKHQVPLDLAKLLWEDKPYTEQVDVPFNRITARMFYAMLQNKPISGEPWLDALIIQNTK